MIPSTEERLQAHNDNKQPNRNGWLWVLVVAVVVYVLVVL